MHYIPRINVLCIHVIICCTGEDSPTEFPEKRDSAYQTVNTERSTTRTEMAFSAAGIDREESFIPLLKKTPYSQVLDERLVYGVFVHRATFVEKFHHCIVLCDKGEKYGFVTLELGKNDTYSRVVPICQVYQGEEKDLEFKGTVEATMRELAAVAIAVLREMGDYNLFVRSCQNFCNTFLARVDLKEGQYWTTTEKVGVGAAIVGGVALFGGLVYSLLSNEGSRKRNSKESKDRMDST